MHGTAQKLTLKITAKGQVTLNRRVLEHLGVRPGDKIDVSLDADHEVSMSPSAEGQSIESVFGFLKAPGDPVLTLDEIKRSIEASWAGER